MSDKNKEVKVSFRISRELSDKIKADGKISKVARKILEAHYFNAVPSNKNIPKAKAQPVIMSHLNSGAASALSLLDER